MIWSKQRFQHSFQLFPRVLKETTLLLLPLSAIMWGFEILIIEFINKARFTDPESVSMTLVYVTVIAGVLYQGFFSVIWTLYVARSSQRQAKNGHGPHPFSFLKTHFYQAFIEYIRAAISIGLYFLCFIIPSIYRWVQLIFVCLVAAFDPDYLKGKKDALKESARLVQGHFILLLLLVCTLVFLPYAVGLLIPKTSSFQIISIVFIYLISWILSLYFSIYFSLTFFALSSAKAEKPS